MLGIKLARCPPRWCFSWLWEAGIVRLLFSCVRHGNTQTTIMATNSKWSLQEEHTGQKSAPVVEVSLFDDGMSYTDKSETLVVGTTNLYVDGQLRLIPVSLASLSYSRSTT